MASVVGEVKAYEGPCVPGQGGWCLPCGQWGKHCTFWKGIKYNQIYDLKDVRHIFLQLSGGWNRGVQLCGAPGERGSGG